MRIVHVEDFFHPDAGYQVNILSKYMSRLGHEVYIVTSKFDKMPRTLISFFGDNNIEDKDIKFFNSTGVKIIRIDLLAYISGRSIYSPIIFKSIDELKPDIVYVHGNDTMIGIQMILKSRWVNYPIITDNHMLEMASENRFHKLFGFFYRTWIAPIIIRENITVIKTQNDSYVNRVLGIPTYLTPWVSTGSDMLLFHENKTVKSNFREEHVIGQHDMIAVYIGKLDEAKGGKLLAQAFEKKFKNKDGKGITLVIVGNTVGDYGSNLEKMFKESENRIIRFPTQNYMDLPYYYQIADFAIYPRQCSLSFYDAQACGLPVIAENNNINNDRLSHNNGFVFEAENVASLIDIINKMINMKNDEFSEMGKHAANFVKEAYNYSDIAHEYLKWIESTVKAYSHKRNSL